MTGMKRKMFRRLAGCAVVLSVAATAPALAEDYVIDNVTLVDGTADLPLDAALAQEAVHFGLLSASPEMREGTAAFLARRTPDFRGKTPS